MKLKLILRNGASIIQVSYYNCVHAYMMLTRNSKFISVVLRTLFPCNLIKRIEYFDVIRSIVCVYTVLKMRIGFAVFRHLCGNNHIKKGACLYATRLDITTMCTRMIDGFNFIATIRLPPFKE